MPKFPWDRPKKLPSHLHAAESVRTNGGQRLWEKAQSGALYSERELPGGKGEEEEHPGVADGEQGTCAEAAVKQRWA